MTSDTEASIGSEFNLGPLVDGHRAFLAFIESRVGDRAAAEDILQTGYAKVIETRLSLEQADSVVAWFYRILRNAITDHYRHAAAGRRALDQAAADTGAVSDYDVTEQQALCACFRALMPILSPEHREMLERVDLGEDSPSQAAEALGISANAARVRLHRARQALRVQLEKACRTCAEHGCLDCTCGR